MTTMNWSALVASSPHQLIEASVADAVVPGEKSKLIFICFINELKRLKVSTLSRREAHNL